VRRNWATIATSAESANDKTPASGGAAGGTGARSSAGAIKGLFRNAVKAVTARTDDEPPPPRRRSDETDKAFRMAAVHIMRRVIRLPVEAYFAATDYLRDVLDWMNPYGQDEMDDSAELDGSLDTKQNHFSPHL
jgi:hypothetical protein